MTSHSWGPVARSGIVGGVCDSGRVRVGEREIEKIRPGNPASATVGVRSARGQRGGAGERAGSVALHGLGLRRRGDDVSVVGGGRGNVLRRAAADAGRADHPPRAACVRGADRGRAPGGGGDGGTGALRPRRHEGAGTDVSYPSATHRPPPGPSPTSPTSRSPSESRRRPRGPRTRLCRRRPSPPVSMTRSPCRVAPGTVPTGTPPECGPARPSYPAAAADASSRPAAERAHARGPPPPQASRCHGRAAAGDQRGPTTRPARSIRPMRLDLR
jgi:hypothetical protein